MTRWGIIGCGFIAHRMADAMVLQPDAELVAVAARTLSRAEEFAAQHGAARAYGSYEELVQDADIDAVYVATIHPTHAEAIKLCLNAGKPVLCEKPMCMTKQENEEVFALAKEKDLLLVEAIWSRFLPAWRKAKEWVDSGAIGNVKTVFVDFSGFSPFNPDSRLYNMEMGGGSLLDVGVYSLHMALYVLGLDVKTVKATGRLSPTGSDCFATVTLQMENGAIAVTSCGQDCRGGSCEARIMGDNGWIYLPQMFQAKMCKMVRPGQPDEVFEHPFENGFVFEVEEFQHLLQAGKTVSDIAPPASSITVAGIIDESIAQLQ